MPTKYLYRFWCKKCQEFTLFENEQCLECNSKLESFYLTEVPNEKVLQQRKRYKEYKRNKFNEILSMSRFEQISTLFHEELKTEIIECDAGQKKLDEIAAQKREKARQKQIEEKRIYKEKFSHLNRNDLCGCGSRLKYKKCCWVKYKTGKL